MVLQYVNMMLHGVAAIHLPFAAVYMYLSPIPPEVLPIDSLFSGKFKYLTFWNVVSRVCMLKIFLQKEMLVVVYSDLGPLGNLLFHFSKIEFNSMSALCI